MEFQYVWVVETLKNSNLFELLLSILLYRAYHLYSSYIFRFFMLTLEHTTEGAGAKLFKQYVVIQKRLLSQVDKVGRLEFELLDGAYN